MSRWAIGMVLIVILISGCRSETRKEAPFVVRSAKETGLAFANKLHPTPGFNMFKYMYFYNGAGVGAGDFNNDGKIDLFFAANQESNALYLNQGNLSFRDISKEAGIPDNKGWSTGVSVVDINGDDLLDIYVCQVGNFESLHGKNQLLVCQGITDGVPHYKDEAAAYGIDFSGFSTQAAFLDIDLDGDLDLFLLNHSVHQNGTFAPRSQFLGTYHPLSGDRLFRNEGNHFTDITKESAINSSAISYGLGVTITDIDLDGWPDIYAGNDFHENDYLYINQRNGRFSEESSRRMMHTSMYSMGVDAADVNNDGFPEIVSMDMLPSDPYMIRRSLGEDEYDIYQYKISVGYDYQYTRNNLQWNRRNGLFSETGLYSGIYATDWSWSALWMDFDNDSRKDLFVSNGIPKRMNDIDYVNFVSDKTIQDKLRADQIEDKDMALVNKFPEIRLKNKFFHNNGDLQFSDITEEMAGNEPSFSNGAIYADLDNDGDLDIVTNNVDEPVMLYENKLAGKTPNHYLDLKFSGPKGNTQALGTKVYLFRHGQIESFEHYPVRGFLSSMQVPMHIGLDTTRVDSAFVVWPDNTFQSLQWNVPDTLLRLTYQPGLPVFDYDRVRNHYSLTGPIFIDQTAETGLRFKHQENPFQEFTREPLIPHKISTEGPALAIADINHDGLEDFFIGSSKTSKSRVYLQQAGGSFTLMAQPGLDIDSTNEEVDALWSDLNGDGHPDLVVANGGNEYYGNDRHLAPAVFINNGKGDLTKLKDAINGIFMNASVVRTLDANGDGKTDLFLGGRSVPWNYGAIPASYLLINDGSGHFTDQTQTLAPGLKQAGMVTGAEVVDMDKDGDVDLLVCSEWGGIDLYVNKQGRFNLQPVCDRKGWWNFVLPFDADGDGDMDLVAGNLGLNSRFQVTRERPVRLYYADFDDNNKKDQVLTYYLDGKEIPFANKAELQRQIPMLKKKFLYAEDFAKASLEDLFPKEKLAEAERLSADYLANAILINDGHMNFTLNPLPWMAQLSPYRTGVVLDANKDKLPDLLLFGNFYDNNIQLGRYDADFGTLLLNKGKGNFVAEPLNGLSIKGEIRQMDPIKINGKVSYMLAANNDSLRVIGLK